MAIGIIFRAMKRLSFQNLWGLLGLVLRYPLFSIQTFIATLKTFKICQQYFPNTHHQNGRGNAFRHALWCCLIMMYCCKISSPQKSLVWCKKITDFHENIFVNEPLLRAMDLHNNQIGMVLFMQMLRGIHRQFFEVNFFITPLLKMSEEAVFITQINEIKGDKMVIVE